MLQQPEKKFDENIKVLFVEDNPTDYKLFSKALSHERWKGCYQSDWIQSFHEAKEVIGRAVHDIYFIDYSLSDGTGLDLINQLKDQGHQGPFIILTAYDDENFIDRSMQQEIYDYLLKGEITPSLLDRTIRYALERKRTEQRKETLQHRLKLEALGQMVGGIAHELNNLLQPIVLKAENIIDHTDDDYISRQSQKIAECAQTSADIIEDILAFSHNEETHAEMHNFRDICLKQIKFARTMLPSSVHLTLSGFEEKSKAMLRFNPADLFRLFSNMFSNSAYAMDYCGKIHVCLSISANNARISIKDTGPGIPEDIKNKIFVPFFSTKDVGQGTGLGLSSIYGIVQSWGGSVELQTEHEKGYGAVFHIDVPLMPIN